MWLTRSKFALVVHMLNGYVWYTISAWSCSLNSNNTGQCCNYSMKGPSIPHFFHGSSEFQFKLLRGVRMIGVYIHDFLEG